MSKYNFIYVLAFFIPPVKNFSESVKNSLGIGALGRTEENIKGAVSYGHQSFNGNFI